MKALKNIGVGFGVSFIGSVPLGYLNVVGFEILQQKGFSGLVPYLLGVIAEEAIVIYLTLIFARKLAKGGKWVKIIEIASIVFLLALAAYFFFREPGESGESPAYVNYPPFWAGVVLNAINFMQIPFWTGWNLSLLANEYIVVRKNLKYVYILAALVGTLAGMLVFIFGLHYLSENIDGLSVYLIKYIIPMIFIGFAVFQSWKFYGKYYKPKTEID